MIVGEKEWDNMRGVLGLWGEGNTFVSPFEVLNYVVRQGGTNSVMWGKTQEEEFDDV